MRRDGILRMFDVAPLELGVGVSSACSSLWRSDPNKELDVCRHERSNSCQVDAMNGATLMSQSTHQVTRSTPQWQLVNSIYAILLELHYHEKRVWQIPFPRNDPSLEPQNVADIMRYSLQTPATWRWEHSVYSVVVLWWDKQNTFMLYTMRKYFSKKEINDLCICTWNEVNWNKLFKTNCKQQRRLFLTLHTAR